MEFLDTFYNGVLVSCSWLVLSDMPFDFICHESNVVEAENIFNLLLSKAMHQGLQITSICVGRLLLLFLSFTKGNDAIQ